MKLTEAQIGILATLGSVMFALAIFLFRSDPVGEVRGEETLKTWGVYIEPWFLILLFVGIAAAITFLIVWRVKGKRAGAP